MFGDQLEDRMDNGCPCHVYDLNDDDICSNNNVSHTHLCSLRQEQLNGRHSPESFGDTDSAIVVVPPTSESGSGSPDFGRKIISVSDGEERYECYGEGECEDYEINPSSSSTPTASARNHINRHSKGGGGQPFQKRTTWLRTSLRKSPSERRRITSNALASQLYRSSSFNSSSHNSSSGESDDMHADLSLEEDVLDLNERVHMLQQQVSALANNQNSTEADKYYRVKQENAALTARVIMLEEQLRELEMRSDNRLKEEQQRFKELLNKQERERGMELDSLSTKLQTNEKECLELKEEIFRLRSNIDRLKQEKSILQDQALDSETITMSLKEELQKLQELSKREREEIAQERARNTRFLEEITKEMGELRRFKMDTENQQRHNSQMEPPSRLRELEEQIRVLKDENKCFQETTEELQAQILNSSIAEGRSLLYPGEGTSLAAEFEAMSKDEMMETLREQREVNTKLRAYIDGILLTILDRYPSLLEVKGNGLPGK
ncbi:hypothetical protein CHUAL_011769 [Chamberlinius hualienensis]